MTTHAAHLSHSQLVVRRFLRHRLGIFGAVMTLLIYLVAAFVEFLAPHTPGTYQARDVYAPPQRMHWILENQDGRRLQPHVYGLRSTTDYNTGQRVFEDDPDRVIELGLFVRGDSYRFWGLVPSNLHFFGPEGSRRTGVFPWCGPAGSRCAQPHDLRDACFDDDRIGRCWHQPRSGNSDRWRLGLFRRHCRSGDPAADRVPAIPAIHPALDRTCRCHSAHDSTDQGLIFSSRRSCRSSAGPVLRGWCVGGSWR